MRLFNGLFKKEADDTEQKNSSRKKMVCCPVKGTIVSLEDVSDSVFALGISGVGVAISPLEGKLYAPADGTVAADLNCW